MNASQANVLSLPSALQAPFSPSLDRPARRHFVGNVLVQAEALANFNQLLAQLRHFPLECDQLATAARELVQPANEDQPSPSIQQRLQWAAAVSQMIADSRWQPTRNTVDAARIVMDYARSERKLIPASVPRIGGLDDAILIDAAWPQMADELEDYRDYCRLRVIEAELRGCEVGAFAFTRDDWQRERVVEADLIAHTRRVAATSYLPSPSQAWFRVH